MKINNCEKCNCKKNWNGSDITCPFQTSEKFGDNWNCGIIGKIRDLCELAMEGKDHRLHYQYCEDQKYVTIKTDDIEPLRDGGDGRLGLCLWVTWYKSRGRTEAMWILDEKNPPREPNFEDLEVIVKHYASLLAET